jgi:anti-anti-sigma factor
MQATHLFITTDINDHRLIIAASGQLDVNSSPQLDTLLHEALSHPDKYTVILDLSELSYMDSVGIATIMKAHWMLGRSEHRFHIVLAPNSQPDRVMRLGDFNTVLHIIHALDEL